MPFLFPYLVGGAVAYILFVKKPRPCPAGDMLLTDDATGEAVSCLLPADVLCFVVRAGAAGDAKAVETVKGWLDTGAVTKEQVAACFPKVRIG